jgi:tripeptidyl-peptidase-1
MFLASTALGGLRTYNVDMQGTGWSRHPTPVDVSTELPFVISLTQRNLPELKKRAAAVSTPNSDEYGKFLSREQVQALTAPAPSHIRSVTAWLDKHQVPYTRANELLRVSATVDSAAALLSTTFAKYTDSGGRSIVRASAYSLPPDVAEAVATIFGLHGLPLPTAERNVRGSSPAKVTPAVIATTYSMGTPYVNRKGNNRQAVAEFQGQRMDTADLTTFFKAEVPSAQPGDDAVSKFVGEPYTKGTGVEALLDIEFMMGVSPGVKTEFWSFPSNDFCADLHNYTDTLLTGTDTPIVNSISYGWQGNLSQLHCKPEDIDTVDTNWAKLAARGFSMMISSGDSGSGYAKLSCENPETQRMGVEVIDGVQKGPSLNDDLFA